jgi:DNA-binding NarL/FixJ family response regulator
MIAIVIINNNKKCRDCIRANLLCQKDFRVAGLGGDIYEALKLVDAHKPDIVLMDISLDDEVKTAALIKNRSPGTSIIIYTDGKERRILTLVFSGISGYITKKADPELLYLGIRTVYRGGRLMTSEIASNCNTIAAKMADEVLKSRGELRGFTMPLVEKTESPDPADTADTRPELPGTISLVELRIMGFVGQGYTNRQIAEKLMLREGTVRNYVSAVLQKTGLHDRTQMAVYAIKSGL